MRKLCLLIGMLVMASAVIAQDRNVVISDLRGNKSRPAPAMVVLHGADSNPQAFRNQSRLDGAARAKGLVVVYVRLTGQGDVPYMVGLIRSMRADPRISDQPVAIVGHGRGGEVAMRLACEAPNLVAGIGISASKPVQGQACLRGKAKPAIFVHGTADPIAPHDGADGQMSAAQTLAVWAQRNRCSATQRVSRTDNNGRDGTSVVRRRYTGCQAALTHVIVLGGGHHWYTGRGGRDSRLGPKSGEINTGEALVEFLAPLVGR